MLSSLTIAAGHIRNSRGVLLRLRPLTLLSAGLTIIGWALFWACALSIVAFIPIWLPLVAFTCGLALVPARAVFEAKRGHHR